MHNLIKFGNFGSISLDPGFLVQMFLNLLHWFDFLNEPGDLGSAASYQPYIVLFYNSQAFWYHSHICFSLSSSKLYKVTMVNLDIFFVPADFCE